MSYIEEIQELIDNKDWKQLSPYDTESLFELFDARTIGPSDTFTYNLEFFTEFLFVDKYYNKSANFSAGSIFRIALLNTLQMGFSENDYKEFLIHGYRFAIDHGIEHGFSNNISVNSEFLSVDFYKAILNSQELSDRFSSGKFYLINFHAGTLKGLTPQEILKLFLLPVPDANIPVYDQKKLLDVFDTPEEFIDFYNTLHSKSIGTDINLGEVLSKLSQSEYSEALEYYRTRSGRVPSYYDNIFHYYLHNDHEIPQDVIEKLKQFGALEEYISKLTDKQLEDNAEEFSTQELIQNSISLDKIMELKPELLEERELENLSQYRFSTEEEMVKYPFLFDPEAMKYQTGNYLSRKTHKILNSTWKKSQRYNEEHFSTFEGVTKNMAGGYITIKNIKYLKEKTGASNSVVFDVFTKENRKLLYSNIKNIPVLGKLIRKYGNQ
jgi:hypothetical protein